MLEKPVHFSNFLPGLALRLRKKIGFLAVLFLCSISTVLAVEPVDFAKCFGKDPRAVQAIFNAIATHPKIAGNPEAVKAFLAIIAQESEFNPAAGNSSSFGLGQINFCAHQKEIFNRMGVSKTVYPKCGGADYTANKKEAGAWLMSHPQENADMAADVFSGTLSRFKGDIAKAIHYYCGGPDACSDPNYMSHVNSKLQKVASCTDGTAYYVYVPDEPGAAPLLLQCPDLELEQALSKANEYFIANSIVTSREAREQATKELRTQYSSWAKNNLGTIIDVDTSLCVSSNLGSLEKIIQTLLSPLNLLVQSLFSALQALASQVCNYVAATINNALSQICIPMPSLFDLPGFNLKSSHSSCNGMSLNDLIWAQSTNAISMPGEPLRLENTDLIRPIYRGAQSFDASAKKQYNELTK